MSRLISAQTPLSPEVYCDLLRQIDKLRSEIVGLKAQVNMIIHDHNELTQKLDARHPDNDYMQVVVHPPSYSQAMEKAAVELALEEKLTKNSWW